MEACKCYTKKMNNTYDMTTHMIHCAMDTAQENAWSLNIDL